jgi:hypothetical protein
MSAVLEAIAAARLKELWQFAQNPPEVMAQIFTHLGVDPVKLQSVIGAMTGADDEPIPVPRSWPRTHWDAWDALPYSLREYLSEREKERDKDVRRCQNEAAAAKKEAATLKQLLQQQPIGENNGKEDREDKFSRRPLQPRAAEIAQGKTAARA